MGKRRVWAGFLIGAVCFFQTNILQLQAETSWPRKTEIEGETAIVMEASTGTVLFEKDMYAKRYPASITKIVTALLAIENSSLKEKVVFSEDAVYKTEGSSIDRDAGEIMTMEQCMYGMMLESANECAYAIAEHTGGSYDAFIRMMNERAKELGCQNTHFNNPHGLPDEKHYTCVYDMALICREALKNRTFCKITGTKKYTIPPTNKHKEKTELRNTHKMLIDYSGAQYLYEGCIGGKTGYTDAAKNTLVTFAKRDGMTLICVVLNEGMTKQYLDTTALLDDCFDNFRIWNVVENEQSEIQTQIQSRFRENKNTFPMLDENGSIVLPKKAKFADASIKIIEDTALAGKAGSVRYTYAGRQVGGADIIVPQTEIPVIAIMGMQMILQKEIPAKTGVGGVVLKVVSAVLLLGIGFLFFRDRFYPIRNRRIRKRSSRRKSKRRKVRRRGAYRRIRR